MRGDFKPEGRDGAGAVPADTAGAAATAGAAHV